MRIFVYDWELSSTTPTVKIIAHSLDDHDRYVYHVVSDFRPFCYVPVEVAHLLRRCKRVEYVSSRSSLNINQVGTYAMVYYDDHDAMRSECGNVGYAVDVDPITLYLARNDYPFVGWFDLTDSGELIHLRGEIRPTNPKIMYFDIECVSSLGYGMAKAHKRKDVISVMSIVFKRYLSEDEKTYLLYLGRPDEVPPRDKYDSTSFSDEGAMLERFREIVMEEDPTVISGYNIFGFDLKYILDRCKLKLKPFPNLSRCDGGSTTTRQIAWSTDGYGDNHYTLIDSSGRVFLDMMIPFKRMKLPSHSLDYVSKKYLGVGKVDGVTHEEIWKDRSKFAQYCEYCIWDSVLVMKLFEHFKSWDDVCETAGMLSRISDIYTRGEQMKVLNLFMRECIASNVVPKHTTGGAKWRKLEGGFVIDPKPGIYYKCIFLDFGSMYPTIIEGHNICPSTHVGGGKFDTRVEGIVPRMVKKLMDMRKAVKAEMKNEKDPTKKMILNFRQLALKIGANAMYGTLSFEGNKYMGHYQCAAAVTRIGRQVLNDVRDYVSEKYGVDVVYGDTDSILLHFGESTDESECVEMAKLICTSVNKKIGHSMSLNSDEDDFLDSVILFSKKRYVTFKGTDITPKGIVTVRSNYCDYTKGCYNAVLEMIRDGVSSDDIVDRCVEFSYVLLSGDVPVEDLVLYKTVQALEDYKMESVPQFIMAKRLKMEGYDWTSKLEYVFVDNGKRLQGDKMFTPDEVKRKDMPIDYDYYLKVQLLPSLKDLFSVLGLGDVKKVILPMII